MNYPASDMNHVLTRILNSNGGILLSNRLERDIPPFADSYVANICREIEKLKPNFIKVFETPEKYASVRAHLFKPRESEIRQFITDGGFQDEPEYQYEEPILPHKAETHHHYHAPVTNKTFTASDGANIVEGSNDVNINKDNKEELSLVKKIPNWLSVGASIVAILAFFGYQQLKGCNDRTNNPSDTNTNDSTFNYRPKTSH